MKLAGRFVSVNVPSNMTILPRRFLGFTRSGSGAHNAVVETPDGYVEIYPSSYICFEPWDSNAFDEFCNSTARANADILAQEKKEKNANFI